MLRYRLDLNFGINIKFKSNNIVVFNMDDFKKYSPFTGKPYSKTALEIWEGMEKDQIGFSCSRRKNKIKKIIR